VARRLLHLSHTSKSRAISPTSAYNLNQESSSYPFSNEAAYPYPPSDMSSHAADSDGDVDIRSGGQQSPLASQRTKETGGTAQRMKRFDGMFPLGYKQGFSQWWASIPAAQAEQKVLSFVPHLQQPPTQMVTNSEPPSASPSAASIEKPHPNQASHVTKTSSVDDPYGPRRWHSRLVALPGKNRAINEFSVERMGEKADQNLVIVHGYGAGLGFFYKNFEGLSRVKGWQLYALDLLGMGRSSRPPFKLKAKQREQQITEAEDWFVDSLEEWRIAKKIDRFTLLGHSMGGYMAVAYALKYPGRLNKLILASPVGIPEDPYAVNADMPEPGSSTLANEFTQDQDTETATASNGSIDDSAKVPARADNNNFLNARAKAEKSAAKNKDGAPADPTTAPPSRRPLAKWLTYLWDANLSPFSLVRWSGPLGPRLVSGWTSRRFSHLPPSEAQALHEYAYSLFRLRGSGEYALAYILAPGAFARSPLIRRIQGVGRQYISAVESNSPIAGSPSEPQASSNNEIKRRENGIPIVLMYGENDWMDVGGGYAAKEKIDAEKKRILKDASDEERRRDNGDSKVLIIKKAGHHVYLDGWEEFNELMREEMEDVRRREEKGR
jgi:cardiolipin-specific phospholipase